MPFLRFIEPLSDPAATMNLTASGQKSVAGASIILAIGLLVLGWTRICTAQRRPTDTVKPLKGPRVRRYSALAIVA